LELNMAPEKMDREQDSPELHLGLILALAKASDLNLKFELYLKMAPNMLKKLAKNMKT